MSAESKLAAARLARTVARGELRRLRDEIRTLERERRELLRRVRLACRASRLRARAAAKALRLAEHARIRREVAELKLAERNRCAARGLAVRAAVGRRIEGKRALLEEKRGRARAQAMGERHRESELSRMRAREKMAESDDEVRSNIDAELIPIFELVRKSIVGIPGRVTRTEAFLEWVEANSDEIWALRAADAERQVAELVKAEEKAQREARRAEARVVKCEGACPKPARRARVAGVRARAAELPEAPF